MPMTPLSQASAFNPGAHLWVIPNHQSSKFAYRLDWYLNFQLYKNQRHTLPSINKQLSYLIKECDLDLSEKLSEKNSNENGILISSENLLPNRWVIQIPYYGDITDWCKKIITSWQGLKEPSLRVFLPTRLSTGEFQSTWNSLYSFDDLTIVVD